MKALRPQISLHSQTDIVDRYSIAERQRWTQSRNSFPWRIQVVFEASVLEESAILFVQPEKGR